MPSIPELTKSSENILWGLANFFLQLFVWGLPTGLFLFLASPGYEGFVFLASITGLAGIIWAVVPLWMILYPKERNKPHKTREDRDAGWWVSLFLLIALGGFVIFAILFAAFSTA